MNSTPLAEVTGGVPKPPSAPDVEDVLGPPPHAPSPPHVGKRGSALALVNRHRHAPPPPPHVGRQTPRQPQQPAPAATQKVIVEQQPYKPDTTYMARGNKKRNPFSPNALAGRRNARAAHAAKMGARQPQAAQPQPQAADTTSAGDAQPTPAMRQARAAHYQKMRDNIEALRRPDTFRERGATP